MLIKKIKLEQVSEQTWLFPKKLGDEQRYTITIFDIFGQYKLKFDSN